MVEPPTAQLRRARTERRRLSDRAMTAFHPGDRSDRAGGVRYLLGGRMAEVDVMTGEQWQAYLSAHGLRDCGTAALEHLACNPITGVLGLDALHEVDLLAAASGAEKVVLLLDASTPAATVFGLAAGSASEPGPSEPGHGPARWLPGVHRHHHD